MKLKIGETIKLYDKVYDIDREATDNETGETIYILTGWNDLDQAITEEQLLQKTIEGAVASH